LSLREICANFRDTNPTPEIMRTSRLLGERKDSGSPGGCFYYHCLSRVIEKQRLSQWYNLRNRRSGPLWEDRFKSVLVQGEPGLLAMVAAYIDLNAVRAGLVKDPRDWRWCGYAEAAAAQSRARNGLPKRALLHQRIRYFTDGLVLGSAAFVEEVFRRKRRSLGITRKVGPRVPRQEGLGDLRTLKDLRGSVTV